MFYVPDSYLENLIEEDLHIMDATTAALGIENLPGSVECTAKRECVAAGIEEASRVFELAGAKTVAKARDGERVRDGSPLLEAHGTAGRLHAAYKVAQNILEYASGIATRTAAIIKNARSVSSSVEVCVTRKHFPGTKRISLKAALAGGARVHRLGLSDSILVFGQHREFLGPCGFIPMISKMKKIFPEKKIAAEADTPEEALSFAEAGVDIVQCERFNPKDLKIVARDAKKIANGVTISAAGGINADNAAVFAATGVDILVTSCPYFGKPEDMKMKFSLGADCEQKPPETRRAEARLKPEELSIRKDKMTGEVILTAGRGSWGGFFKELENLADLGLLDE
ncbi:MAG: ModD protein [Synergistaceae bacterium]|jgi:molybdenum transport protein|nr:ModD protein [Synergistaceae bacterium]